MKNKSSTKMLFLFLFAGLLFLANPVLAKGISKGTLDKDEISFLENTLLPILISSNICTSVKKDCRHDYFICASTDALACDVYGIANENVIKEILLAVLNSKLKVSAFKFWRSKYHETTLLEKPLLEFIDRTGK